jgi:hypothetical protein
MVYYNIVYGKISQYGSWHEIILTNAKNWDLAPTRFERVLVLNSDGKSIVELHPRLAVIKEEPSILD